MERPHNRLAGGKSNRSNHRAPRLLRGSGIIGAMTYEHHLDLITRFYDEMWNQFDKTLFAEILEPTIRFRGSLGQEKVGYTGTHRGRCSALPRRATGSNTPVLRFSLSPRIGSGRFGSSGDICGLIRQLQPGWWAVRYPAEKVVDRAIGGVRKVKRGRFHHDRSELCCSRPGRSDSDCFWPGRRFCEPVGSHRRRPHPLCVGSSDRIHNHLEGARPG